MKMKFEELYERYFDIQNIFAVSQNYEGKTTFTMSENRSTDALLLYSGTTGICYQEGEEPIQIPFGALMYMPQGSRYTWENSPFGGNFQENLLFEFTLYDEKIHCDDTDKHAVTHEQPEKERIFFGDKVQIVTVSHTDMYRKLFKDLIEALNRKDYSPLSVYTSAYGIFDALAKNERAKTVQPVKNDVILDGIRMIESNEDVSVEEIANKCCMSVSYFEKLFKQYAGISPSDYKMTVKINKIKMMLQNENNTLKYIADSMNFCDVGYLCRIFKRKTGMTPNEYRELYHSYF